MRVSRLVCLLICITAVVLTVSCGGSVKHVGCEDKFSSAAFWEEAENEFGGSGGFYELMKRTTRIEWEGKQWVTTVDCHDIVVVLEAVKMKDYPNVRIPLSPVSRLVEVKALTITAGGSCIPVNEMFKEALVPGFPAFSETREMVFTMPRFQDRCVFDIRYRLRRETQQLDDAFLFGASLAVRRAEYSYVIPSTLPAVCDVHYKFYNAPGAAPIEEMLDTDDGTFRKYTWVREDIGAFLHEKHMPPAELFMPRIQVYGTVKEAEYPGWAGFSKYYSDVLSGHCALPEKFRAQLVEATADAATDREKIEIVRDIISDEYRYVEFDIQDTRWEPQPLKDIYRYRYGDSKGLSVLAVCALRELGIEAYPALVRTKDKGVLDREVTAPRFNHMLVYIEDEDIYMDPALGAITLGMLAPDERGLDALVISGPEPVWKMTPREPRVESRRERETKMAIMPDGSAEGRAEFTLRGDIAVSQLLTYESKTPEEIKVIVEDAVRMYTSGAAVSDGQLLAMEFSPPQFDVAASFKKDAAGLIIEDRIAVSLGFLEPPLIKIAEELASETKRRYSAVFPYRWSEIETIYIDVPAGYQVEELPVAAAMEGINGSYSLDYSLEGSQVVVKRVFSLHNRVVDIKDMDKFVAFWNRARTAADQKIMLKAI